MVEVSKDAHPVDLYVGSRVRMRRLMMGLSQNELGEALGITFQQIQKYEKGANRIGASRLFDISNILKVNVQYFYIGINQLDTHPGQIADTQWSDDMSLVTTPENLQLCQHFRGIENAAVKKTLLDLVKALAEEKSVHQP